MKSISKHSENRLGILFKFLFMTMYLNILVKSLNLKKEDNKQIIEVNSFIPLKIPPSPFSYNQIAYDPINKEEYNIEHSVFNINTNFPTNINNIHSNQKSFFDNKIYQPNSNVDHTNNMNYFPKDQGNYHGIEDSSKVNNTNQVSHCHQYTSNNVTCIKCEDGYFLYNNQTSFNNLTYTKQNNQECLTKCYKGYAANLLDKKCTKYDYYDYYYKQNSTVSNLNNTYQIKNDTESNQTTITEDNNISLVYWYYFTFSTCSNFCGQEYQECSCKPDCVQLGNCCKDFKDICEEYFYFNKNASQRIKKEKFEDKNLLSPKILNKRVFNEYKDINKIVLENCLTEFKSPNKGLNCIKCKDKYYWYNKECVSKCPDKTKVNNDNKVCENITCSDGEYFIPEDKICVAECPNGLRANKENMTCISNKLFTFHWVFPSKGSCKGVCGEKYNIDCSCNRDCFRLGNCCEDFEKECYQESVFDNCGALCVDCSSKGNCLNCKDNAKIVNNTCSCLEGYKHNLSKDACLIESKKELNIIFANETLNSTNLTYNNFTALNKEVKHSFNKNFNDKNVLPLTSEGKKIFDLMNDVSFLKNENKTIGNGSNCNVTINIIAFNTNPKIISENTNIVNSYNKK